MEEIKEIYQLLTFNERLRKETKGDSIPVGMTLWAEILCMGIAMKITL